MNSSYTNYRILKSGWGIWIQITASSEFSVNDGIKISENISLEYKVSNIKLSKEQKGYIQDGLIWISPKLEAIINKPVKIILEEIVLVFTDYQIEGLFYASAFWVCEHFGLEMPLYDYGFDSKNNKYIFPDLQIKK